MGENNCQSFSTFVVATRLVAVATVATIVVVIVVRSSLRGVPVNSRVFLVGVVP